MLHYWALLQGLASLPSLSLCGFICLCCVHISIHGSWDSQWTLVIPAVSSWLGVRKNMLQQEVVSINMAKLIIPRRVPLPLKISSVYIQVSQCKHMALNFTSFTIKHCCTAMEGKVWILFEVSTTTDTKPHMKKVLLQRKSVKPKASNTTKITREMLSKWPCKKWRYPKPLLWPRQWASSNEGSRREKWLVVVKEDKRADAILGLKTGKLSRKSL